MNNWIKSHEMAIVGVAGAVGSLAASTLPEATNHSIVAGAVICGSVTHLVDRCVKAFIRRDQDS